MPISGYPGQVISATAPTVSTAGATGIWGLDEQLQYAGQNLWPGYQISRSVRLRAAASAYFSRTFSSGGSQTTWTFSFWYKRGLLSQSSYPDILSTNSGSPNQNNFRWQADDTLLFYVQSSASTLAYLQTTQVFRDPSSWYHIVLTIDTTNATSTDRVRLYVNGQRVTSFSTATYPSQNQTLPSFNGAVTHYFGASNTGAGFNDCYMTEVNFVNGQALTPSSFGVTNAATGVWGPIKYTGTYGTTGFYLPFPLNNTSSYGASFNGSSQYLTTSTNASLALGTNSFTVEYWLYISSNVGGVTAVSSGNGTTTYDGLFGYQTGSQSILLYLSSTGSSWDIASGTTIGSTPTGTWNHVAITRNGSTFYTFVNGVQGATFTSSASIYQSANSFVMGRAQSNTPLNGYLSNVRVVVGTALYTSNFVPPTTALTAVTNTKLLTLQNATIVDNSTNALTFTNTGSVTTSTQYPFANPTIGSDSSGNYNNWAPNNINVTTTGTTYDSMPDAPVGYGSDTGVGGEVRGNYAVWNPLDMNSGLATSNANLSVATGGVTSVHRLIRGTMGFTTPCYFEMTTSGGNSTMLVIIGAGEATANPADGTYLGSYSKSFGLGYSTTANNFYTSGVTNANGSPTNVVDGTWGFALDPANGKGWIKNTSGAWIGGGDPAAGTSPTMTWTSDGLAWFPAASLYNVASSFSIILNAGQRAFAYTAPSGFKALVTQNLPTPTIANGAGYMAATLYTGTGSSQSITNTVGTASFKPDLVWTKGRSGASNHSLVDSVRGITLQLSSNLTASEVTDATEITALNSNGFSVGNSSGAGYSTNANGTTYVAWQWLAGAGSSSTNTNGSITSTVSVNQTAGFSIVTYTGTGTTGTVGHGLGVTPTFLFTKIRQTSAGESWTVYFAAVGNAYNAFLNSTAAAATAGGTWNSTSPTSTVFTVQGGAWANINGNTMVAYCFAPIAGYSAFGSYTGNGSTDGPFVYCGFRPRFVLIKRSDSTGNWFIWDSARNTYNAVNNQLYPDSSSAEQQADGLDFVSNGFKIRFSSTYADRNANGGTYVYAAFAENPFKFSLAR